MSCYSCENTSCCPEHCCDWDTCSCKDCENCGGVASVVVKKPLPVSKSSVSDDTRSTSSGKSAVKPVEPSIHDEIAAIVQKRLKEQKEHEAEAERKFEEKRRLDKARHDEVLASSRETIARNQAVLANTQGTIDRLQGLMDGIKETEQKFKDFQDNFGKAMAESLERCFGTGEFLGLENIEQNIKKYGKPKTSSVEEVSALIANSSSVSFITGAGISAESGVFTYKGNSETCDISGKQMTLQEIMNIDVFRNHPLEFWKNIQYNRARFSACSPNKVHQAIADLLFFFNRKNRKVYIVTQNIDGFDKAILGGSQDLFEIHGNTHEMRCSNDCCDTILVCPDTSTELTQVPLCTQCGAMMRPNVLLYGESYTEKWYRADTAAKLVENSELLVVIGTQIKCGFPDRRVKEFAKSSKNIVEINVEPVIQYGKVFVLPTTCGKVVPSIVQNIRKKK